MLPLVGIATAVIPDLIKIIAGDRAGKVADSVAAAVSTATGTTDPQAAQKKIDELSVQASACKKEAERVSAENNNAQAQGHVSGTTGTRLTLPSGT